MWHSVILQTSTNDGKKESQLDATLTVY